MTPINNILVPLDFSEASTGALRYACQLADRFGASLHLLHAAGNPYLPGGYMEFYAPPPELFEQLDRDAIKQLGDALTPEEKSRYRAVLVYRSGDASHEILNYLAEDHHIDLVVMATHGRGGIARLMLGSVAERVLRAAPCPVLTLRPSSHASSGQADRAA